MQVPVKITPDRIRDSIVQVYFESDIPYLPLIGYFHSYLLSMDYDFASGENNTNLNKIEVDLSFLNHLFVSNKHGIKINIHPNGSIIFNCIDNYIGWESYSSEIYKVLSKLMEVGIIKTVTRIGVRFTSEFPNINLLDNINFAVNYDLKNKSLNAGNFNIELTEDNYRIILNLVSNLRINNQVIQNDIASISLIDVDVIKDNLLLLNFNEVKETINQIHIKQKETFFSLLKEDFLSSLNPEY